MPRTKGLLENQVIYNGYVFTKDRKRGYYLSAKPIYNGKRINLHRYIWIVNNGEIPEGFDVHHKDQNKDNNGISNLGLLPNAKHSKYHINKEMLEHYEERKRKNLLNLRIQQQLNGTVQRKVTNGTKNNGILA